MGSSALYAHGSQFKPFSPLLGAKSVTVENSPTGPGTLGNYQPLAIGLVSWVRY